MFQDFGILSWFALSVLVLALGAQVIHRRSFCRFRVFQKICSQEGLFEFIKWLWRISLAVVFAGAVYFSWLQYQVWTVSPVMRFVLPPHSGIGYFLTYVASRFFYPWILSGLAAFLTAKLAERFNKKFGDRFFEKEEIKLISLGVFLSGWPGFLFYLGVILVLGALISVFYQIFARGRLPLYYFWMTVAIFVMIIWNWIWKTLGLEIFIGQFILGDFWNLIFGVGV